MATRPRAGQQPGERDGDARRRATWNDVNYLRPAIRATATSSPDCDLRNHGRERRVRRRSTTTRFGTVVTNTTYADDVLNGFGVRPYTWQGSVAVQHELRPNVALMVGYFRTWYGNFYVTDNLHVTAADFDPYCVTAPTDARLPDGGGYDICGLVRRHAGKPSARRRTSVRQASDFGDADGGLQRRRRLHQLRGFGQGGIYVYTAA